MSPLEVLKAARAKIEKPENWCKGSTAVTQLGTWCLSTDPAACRFCAIGAIRSVSDGFMDEFAALRALERCLSDQLVSAGTLITVFNDRPETTHADVLATFDAAIASLEAAQ